MANMVFNPRNDFIGIGSTYDMTYGAFGVTAYLNRESMNGGNDVALSAHIAPCVEMGCGAHYYSHGKYTSTYRSAETIINLDEINVDTKGKRVACISLGVIGMNSSCDMGIESMNGTDWFAHYWCPGDGPIVYDEEGRAKRQGSYGNLPVVSGAKKVKIKVTPSRNSSHDYVTGEYTWYNSSNAVIKTETLTCETDESGMIFVTDSSGLTIQRFHRFMSLIPKDGMGYTVQSDRNDGSYLLGGNLTSNKLYLANGSSVTWGTNLMDYIWSVQGWNINSFSPGNNDSFSCTHTNDVYQ